MASVARVLFSTLFLFNLVFNLNGGMYVCIVCILCIDFIQIFYSFYINMMLAA
jgi:hypothetical protein